MAERPTRNTKRTSATPRRSSTTRRTSARSNNVLASSSKNNPSRTSSRSTRNAASSSRRSATTTSSRSKQTAYNEPAVWTKNASRAAQTQGGFLGVVKRVFSSIGKGLLFIVTLIGRGLGTLLQALATLVARSRVALVVVIAVVVLGVGALVDFGINVGKAYPGVHIGEIDAAGKTSDELSELIQQTYGTRLAANEAVIYANDEAASHIADETAQRQDVALSEQIAVEEAQANKLAWVANATTLNAQLPVEALVSEALAVGREDGGVLARLSAAFSGWQVEPRATYEEALLESLATDIDATVGNARVDWGFTIADGVATVSEGHDGHMLNRAAFSQQLDGALLGQQQGGSFVAHPEYTPLRIDSNVAQQVCAQVNRAIGEGVQFSYAGTTWDASATDVGSWVRSRVAEQEGGYQLVPYVDDTLAKPGLLAHVEQSGLGRSVQVTFEAKDDGSAVVYTDGTGTIPLAADAAHALDSALFGENGKAYASSEQNIPVALTIEEGAAPTQLTFEEALDLGIVGEVSSYTTEFTTTAGTENRNHNIALVAQKLSNSVVKAKGGHWSFNDTAGECNEAAGFLGAGAIVDGEVEDAVGGGICQVATTVFNAVYEGGYPVIRRHNHSLYISSYPQGRDAAVSWPDLDLIWENDADSDVLVRLSCAEGSVTATLYGVNPGYQVSSSVGDWGEGEEYKTKTITDDSLAPGASYIKTRGADGSTISVIRTVKNESGSVLHEDLFASVYDPVTEVIVAGPNTSNNTSDTSTASE